jgi:hypothetical protein
VTALAVEPLKDLLKEEKIKQIEAANAMHLFNELFGCISDNWPLDLGQLYSTSYITKIILLRAIRSCDCVRRSLPYIR